MKRKSYLFAVLSLLLSLIFAPVAMAKTDKKHIILVNPKNPIIQIKLVSNPTTGYAWFIRRYNPHLLRPEGQKYIPPNTQRLGAGGETIFTFRVLSNAFKAKHITAIKLVYIRPWDLAPGKKEKFFIVTS